MSTLTENYNIKDLYIIKFKKSLIDNIGISNDSVNYFRPDLYYIVERFYNFDDKRHTEVYRECIAGEDFYIRESKNAFLTIPKIFESMEPLPLEYLDKEEIEFSKISTTRIFQIFQEINYKKVKRLGRK